MNSRRWWIAVATAAIVAILAGAAVDAQTRPDFSGRWVQITPAAKAEGGGSEQVITQDKTTVTTEHVSEGGGHRQVHKIDAESTSMVGQIEVVSKAVWIWSLSPDGTMAVAVTATKPDGTTEEIKTVHRKK